MYTVVVITLEGVAVAAPAVIPDFRVEEEEASNYDFLRGPNCPTTIDRNNNDRTGVPDDLGTEVSLDPFVQRFRDCRRLNTLINLALNLPMQGSTTNIA